MSSRRWVLVASERALDKPCSTALRISCWYFVIVLASLTNAGRRQRCAHASQPTSRRLAEARSRAWKTARSCSFRR